MKNQSFTARPCELTREVMDRLRAAQMADTAGGLRSLDEVCAGAIAFEIVDDSGAVCNYAVRVDRCAGGYEAVIVAAAGDAAGANLTNIGIAAIEKQFAACQSIMLQTSRKGLVKKLAPLGFRVAAVVLRKRLQCH